MAAAAAISASPVRLISLRKPPHPSIPKTLIPQNLQFFRSISIQRIPTKSSTSISRPSSSPSSSLQPQPQPIEELPPKLQEMVTLFQSVPDPKAKYEQLLFYARKLAPLHPRFKTPQNRVPGCVSQVWVHASFHAATAEVASEEEDDDSNHPTVRFEADSDSALTKGLAALLVLGLSGRPVQEILRVSPDFALLLGLHQSLTPSRNNGFVNMLKFMQKKALTLYVEAQQQTTVQPRCSEPNNNSGIGGGDDGSPNIIETSPPQPQPGLADYVGGVPLVMGRGERIREKLERELKPTELVVDDISYQHAGHAGVSGRQGETHFNVRVVSGVFEGKSLVKRHRLVYDLLQEELQNGLHALSIVANTPSEG